MNLIRKNIFETNSSSTHVLAISKKSDYTLPEKLRFDFGEFGWGYEVYRDVKSRASYLITAIYSFNKETVKIYLNKLANILEENNIQYSFPEPEPREEYDGYDLDYSYVDHAYELKPWLDNILDNPDKVLRFLFNNDSYITTGNDNENGFMFPNKEINYDSDGYNKNWDELIEEEQKSFDLFFKGN